MEIEAPFGVSLVEKEDGNGHELHLNFNPDFRARDVATQGSRVTAYVADLRQQVRDVTSGSREQQGMLTVLQIAEQLLPHIEAGELELDQTIIVEVVPQEVSDDKPIGQQLST